MTGGGVVNSTHMIAFQEKSNSSLLNKNKVTFERNRLCKLPPQQECKQNPPSIEFSNVQDDLYELNDFLATYNIWIIMRMLNSDDQGVPIFTGWQLNNRKKQILDFDKTVVMYLSPLPTKVTDFQTIFKYLTYLQGLAITTNMPFVNVTLDIELL